jgi:ubiquinone/menaquinone biosynthesis C-methylase UbiE
MADDIRHPLFARLFDRLSRTMEKEIGRHRDELLAGLSGRVVEVGAGNGINFRHYPTTVDEVVAIEPEPFLRSKAIQAAAAASVPVRVWSALADRLDLADGSCDAGVACLVLCTVQDLPGALAELRRVVAPGGELRFLEHVRSERAAKARVQRGLDRSGIWPLLGGGCHCSRDTLAAIESSGFSVENVKTLNIGPAWGHTNPHLLGSARS